MTDTRVDCPVHIIGTGLLGASIGLGLRARGTTVTLEDVSPSSARLAADYGAGIAGEPAEEPGLVVVAVPPDVTATVVAGALERFPNAIVTDVASVKRASYEELERRGADLSRYLGSHPMAGRERGGAISARADLFIGRPWVIAGHGGIPYRSGRQLEALILDLGATPIEMTIEEHDRAVGLVSHVPQIVSTLMAARLAHGESADLALAGQGVRDVTRVAASDPALWVQILEANRANVAEVLTGLRDDLDTVVDALSEPDAQGARRALAETLAAGNAGVARLPGKHGSSKQYLTVTVMVDDRPGQLARLFADVGELGVNIEDFRMEHSPKAQIGLTELQVLPESHDDLTAGLEARGWRIAG